MHVTMFTYLFLNFIEKFIYFLIRASKLNLLNDKRKRRVKKENYRESLEQYMIPTEA